MPENPKLCQICQSPLGEPELANNRPWHYDCAKCHYCGDTMPSSHQIQKCLDSGIPVSHETCHKTQLFQDFKNKTLPVTQAHIDALNEQITGFYPAVNPSVDDVDILYKLLMSIQVCAANVSYALGLTKEKLLIRESRNFDHQQKQQRTAKAEQTRSAAEIEQKRIERQLAMKAERENPAIRDRRKAKESAMKLIGYTDAQAEAYLDSITQITQPKPN